MRVELELKGIEPITGPGAPPCRAICPDSPVAFEHPCPWTARWLRDGVELCGQHVARRVVLIEIPDAAAAVIQFRKRTR